MRKYLFIFLMTICGFSFLSFANDPTLMTINDKSVPLSEFQYIYSKNNSNNVIDKKTLKEYLNMFVKFRLKVAEAEAEGLDTTRSFKNEYYTYKNQLSTQYLKDDAKVEELTKQMYERMKNEVEASQIVLLIDKKGTSEDTLATYKKAMEIYEKSKNEDFSKLAKEYSADPNAVKSGGYIGWLSEGKTPYTFENVLYNTPVGEVSKPVRTFIGYHIIKVKNRRLSPGKVRVAHILLLNKANDLDVDAKNKIRIDSIYNALENGANFEEMAKNCSEDPASAVNGGKLPIFGVGQMIPKFENAAFALQKTDELSKPIKTEVGWHIIKLLDKKPLDSYEKMKDNLTTKVKNEDKAPLIEYAVTDKLKKEYNFKGNSNALEEIYRLVDKYAPNDSMFIVKAADLNKVLFTFADKSYTQQDFIKYLEPESNGFGRGVRTDFIKDKYKEYESQMIQFYERKQLVNKYPEYKNLINEYHDGILLFDVMNKNVWEKATTDTVGIGKFFIKNRAKYKWNNPRYKGEIILCKDKPTLEAAEIIVKNANKDSVATYLYKRLNDSVQYVRIEKGLWKKGDNKYIDKKIFKDSKVEVDKAYPYSIVRGKLLKNPENYIDVKGIVTSDYQDYLDKTWTESLRKKYRVKVYQDVLDSVK